MDGESFPIVGIGASAGGIPAMEAFFAALGPQNRMAFVVITHLSPDRASQLHEVIAHQTELPVEIARDGVQVEAGHVYVMPEKAVLSMSDGRLRLREEILGQHERRPIDIFFSSLAEDQGQNAVGIVLSGGDSDGTLGVKIIKEKGGVTFAQTADGSGPKNPEMPESAIDSGLVDFAIPASEMPDELERFVEGTPVRDEIAKRSADQDMALETATKEIARLLKNHSGQDFSKYKSKTFLRRVARRMQITHDRSIETYLDHLREQPEEIMALFRDLLINVTEFFRDAEAFSALETLVIPKLFEGRGADDTVRVWVPGCSTGEEVYSIAILLSEAMEKLEACPRVQVFATDIDERALAIARSGRYPLQHLSKLSARRRKHHFRREGDIAIINQDVRDLCVFSCHNLISDPPFSRMDLVSCRNLLIYFNRELQDQVVPTFHYALNPGGYLFLGSSESISQHGDLFAPVDQKLRIFQSRGFGAARPRLPILLGASAGDHAPFDDNGETGRASSYQLKQVVESVVLEHYAPAHVVIGDEGDIVYYSARTGRYLDMPRGAPSRQLWDLARSDLRLELRSAFRKALETGARATAQTLLTEDEASGSVPLEMTVEPLRNIGGPDSLFLVVFSAGKPVAKPEPQDGSGDPLEEAREKELRDMRERMQATVEEYETALEELRSSNEELLSVNEEAQSTNEELEASKEEMQSLNEELTTINGELNAKLAELDRANADLRNLYDATQIATIFLDDRLVIRNFTPAAAEFFHLRSGDIGRPLTDLASALKFPELRESIQSVFTSGEMLEHTLEPDGNGHVYLVRLLPYRNAHDQTTGVVVTLVDVTKLAKAEARQRVLIEELNHRVKNMLAVVISIAKSTWRNTRSPDEFIASFDARLAAMSRAYSLLSGSGWSVISLEELLSLELAPYEGRIAFSGENVNLAAETALGIGLATHELATNAAKYGALSNESGQVAIDWSETDGKLHLVWRETGGPPVEKPDENGFGVVLLEGQVAKQLGGTIDFDFASAGLRVDMTVPLSR